MTGDRPTARLRPARVEDIPQITEIYAHHVRYGSASFEEVPPAPAEMAQRLADIRAAGLPWLVAERAGELVGYAYAGPYRTRTAYRFTVEDSVYLDRGAQGCGLGRLLLGAVIDEATRGGRRQMVAVIGDSGNIASIRLHAALGFRTVGTLTDVGFKFGRWLDSVLMQRPLGDPGAGAP